MADNNIDNSTDKLVDQIVATYQDDSGINFIDVRNLPVREMILHILDMVYELLFPGYAGKRDITRDNVRYIVGDLLCHVKADLTEQITLDLQHNCRLNNCSTCGCDEMAHEVTMQLLEKIPQIRMMLKGDVQAAFRGDPAAGSLEEIVISYPFMLAIATHRVAHELYLADIPLMPRMMRPPSSRIRVDPFRLSTISDP